MVTVVLLCCHDAGFKLRRRRITNEPTGGPGNCPHLVEAVPCDEPSCYNWQLVSLDECVPDDGKPCGPGTRLAQVQCVNSNGEGGEFSLIVLIDERISLNLKYNSHFLLSHPVSSAFDPSPFSLKKCRSHIVWQIPYFSRSPLHWPSTSRCTALYVRRFPRLHSRLPFINFVRSSLPPLLYPLSSCLSPC